ncbi:hypothetical protein ABZW10_13395 [Kitasatospora sp. NPDC004723]|uniref:hypothetical protein n=1 Tax=Kitasatospora sp. NPDC004723 TaxID=3154288 RepID=UPI0033BD0B00
MSGVTPARAGGHLPSSTRTNTQDVLFGSYLSGDPTVRDWAESVVGEALATAEDAVRTEHQRLLEAQGGHLHVMAGPAEAARQDVEAAAEKAGISPQAAKAALSGDTDTAFMACQDIEHSPVTPGGGACKASFLACFSCRNAVATEDHLPALLALQDDLAARWEGTDREAWWRRYGQAWVAIAEDIIPAFTPAEKARAAARKPTSTPLDLLEGPKEDQ